MRTDGSAGNVQAGGTVQPTSDRQDAKSIVTDTFQLPIAVTECHAHNADALSTRSFPSFGRVRFTLEVTNRPYLVSQERCTWTLGRSVRTPNVLGSQRPENFVLCVASYE